MIPFLYGAIATAAAVVALIFFRYFSRGKDYFFLLFSIAFAIQAVSNVLAVATESFGDESASRFVWRLIQYLLILVAIAYKNLSRRRTP